MSITRNGWTIEHFDSCISSRVKRAPNLIAGEYKRTDLGAVGAREKRSSHTLHTLSVEQRNFRSMEKLFYMILC
jgi:hypothetical protein